MPGVLPWRRVAALVSLASFPRVCTPDLGGAALLLDLLDLWIVYTLLLHAGAGFVIAMARAEGIGILREPAIAGLAFVCLCVTADGHVRDVVRCLGAMWIADSADDRAFTWIYRGAVLAFAFGARALGPALDALHARRRRAAVVVLQGAAGVGALVFFIMSWMRLLAAFAPAS